MIYLIQLWKQPWRIGCALELNNPIGYGRKINCLGYCIKVRDLIMPKVIKPMHTAIRIPTLLEYV